MSPPMAGHVGAHNHTVVKALKQELVQKGALWDTVAGKFECPSDGKDVSDALDEAQPADAGRPSNGELGSCPKAIEHT